MPYVIPFAACHFQLCRCRLRSASATIFFVRHRSACRLAAAKLRSNTEAYSAHTHVARTHATKQTHLNNYRWMVQQQQRTKQTTTSDRWRNASMAKTIVSHAWPKRIEHIAEVSQRWRRKNARTNIRAVHVRVCLPRPSYYDMMHFSEQTMCHKQFNSFTNVNSYCEQMHATRPPPPPIAPAWPGYRGMPAVLRRCVNWKM